MRGVAINGDVEDIYFAAVEIFAPAVRPLLLFGHYGRSLHASLSKFLPQFLIFFIHLLHDLQQILDLEARLRRTRDCGIGLIVRKLFLELQDIVVLLEKKGILFLVLGHKYVYLLFLLGNGGLGFHQLLFHGLQVLRQVGDVVVCLLHAVVDE